MLCSVVLSGATLAPRASAVRTSTIVSETLRYTCTATNAVRRSVAQGITAGRVTSVKLFKIGVAFNHLSGTDAVELHQP
jgi:hypothetical protein